MADNNTIARPYAQALFDVARADGALDAVEASLAAAKALLADGQIADYLSAPTLNDEKRLTFLQGTFAKLLSEDAVFAGGSKHGTNFLKVLIDNNRVGVLPEISEHFEALKADLENTVDVVVTSATALSDAQVNEISSALNKRLGRNVSITSQVDATLIGGAVITAGDIVIDGSTRARLQGLANALIK
jgi:F-type H+-transporting ATPase subunit delta